MKVYKVFLLSLAALLTFGFVQAQEIDVGDEDMPSDELVIAPAITEAVNLDEDATAEDLDIQEPKLLPDNPFYFFKNWGREIQATFTFNPVKKAELREKFANEKLIELKKVIERKKDAQVIKRATANYQNEVGKIKVAADRIKENAEENPEVDKFLDKHVEHQLLHQRLLQKLETQVPAEAFAKIQEARERHLEKFGEVMAKLEAKPENIGERLKKKMIEIKGSEFKEFKNLEVLKELEEKVPEAAKEGIQQVRANSLIRLKATVEGLPAEKLEQFQTYTESVAGVKEKQVEILDSLRQELKAKPIIRQKLIESRDKILERIRLENIEPLPIKEPAEEESTKEEPAREEAAQTETEETTNLFQEKILEPIKRLAPQLNR